MGVTRFVMRAGQPQTEEATDNADNTDKIDDLEAPDAVCPLTPSMIRSG
jgi:hypothetical protein